MSVLAAIAFLLQFLSGFDNPLLKQNIGNQLDQIEVCANGGCQH